MAASNAFHETVICGDFHGYQVRQIDDDCVVFNHPDGTFIQLIFDNYSHSGYKFLRATHCNHHTQPRQYQNAGKSYSEVRQFITNNSARNFTTTL